MSTAGAAPPIASSAVEADDGEDRVVVVYTCTRLGAYRQPTRILVPGSLPLRPLPPSLTLLSGW